MKRREFVVLSGGAMIALAPPAQAQPAGAMRKIGVLDSGAAKDEKTRLTAFRQGLASLGWTEGKNVRFEIRYANLDVARLTSLAAALLNTAPDVILAVNSPAVLALRARTNSIPIVFVSVSDPVRLGFVASLARPGGNITGFSNYDAAMGSKWLQLLREIAPRLTRVVVIFDPKVPSYHGFVPSIETAARAARIETIVVPIQNAEDIEKIDKLVRKPNAGLITLPSNAAGNNSDEILRLAARHQLPAIYAQMAFMRHGGLMSYVDSASVEALAAASDIDRILRGAKPADLPVQNPTKYVLTINLKTAKALGLTVPQLLLIQADQVIR